MSEAVWQTIKVHHCIRLNREVTLQAKVVYPPERLPDQPPRVIAHRCSFGVSCNLNDKPGCLWSGTNPDYDPLSES